MRYEQAPSELEPAARAEAAASASSVTRKSIASGRSFAALSDRPSVGRIERAQRTRAAVDQPLGVDRVGARPRCTRNGRARWLRFLMRIAGVSSGTCSGFLVRDGLVYAM